MCLFVHNLCNAKLPLKEVNLSLGEIFVVWLINKDLMNVMFPQKKMFFTTNYMRTIIFINSKKNW